MDVLSDTVSVTVQALSEEKEGVGANQMKALKEKAKEAQTNLDADKQSLMSINHIYANLEKEAGNLSGSTPDLGLKNQIMSSLLVADMSSQLSTKVNSSIKSTISACSLVLKTISAAEETDKASKSNMEEIVSASTLIMLETFSQSVLESTQNVSKTFLRTDVQDKTSVELSYGIDELVHSSHSETARKLRDIVQRFKEQLMPMAKFLRGIS